MDGLTTHHDSRGNISWRYQIEPRPNPQRFSSEDELDRIWLDLQLHHSGARVVSPDEYRELASELHDIEQLLLQWPGLAAYWSECHRPVGDPAHGRSAIDVPQLPHVVALQARLMEHAFILLQLQHYPNAPANRGWMNLFRSWGQSVTFNQLFDRALAQTLSRSFVSFYKSFVRHSVGPIEMVPVPHPWDWDPHTPGGRPPDGVYLDRGIREVEVEANGQSSA